MKPYVISDDIFLLMQEWERKSGFLIPNHEFFSELRHDFSRFTEKILPSLERVSEEEISSGIGEIVANSKLPTISLDGVYFKEGFTLDMTRRVDPSGKDKGLGRRALSPSLFRQFATLEEQGLREVMIVDDVLFSGDLLRRLIKLLESMNIHTSIVGVGIGIKEGVQNISDLGCEVKCVRKFKEVMDEVCERDFYPGVPLSGRLLLNSDNVGVPYLSPFGNPEKWASIPQEHVTIFSNFCIVQTIKLFEGIEKCSEQEVFCSDLERKVIGLPTNKTRYVDVLRNILQ